MNFITVSVFILLCLTHSTMGRPVTQASGDPDCKGPNNCIKPWDEADYLNYVEKYNPFNGTDAKFKYNASDAEKWQVILADPKNYNEATSRSSRANWLQCIGYGFGGLTCMYDKTAGVSKS